MLPLQGALPPSLVGELRSLKLCSVSKNKNIKKKENINKMMFSEVGVMKTAQNGAQSLGLRPSLPQRAQERQAVPMCHKGDCDHLLGYPALMRVVLPHTPQRTSGYIWRQLW